MAICQYFLRGTCKFGNNCKNQHYYEDNFNVNPSISVMRQMQNFAPPAPANQIDDKTLIESVVNDMMQMEHGHQWLFSSYSPFKDKTPFPGFEDKTFEEVRLEFYLAEKTGATDMFKQRWKEMCDNAYLKVKALQNPSAAIINILKEIYYSKSSTTKPLQTFHTQQPFQQQMPSVFQQPQQQTQSIFQQPQQTQSIFQQPQQTQSIFQQPQQQTQSVFQQPQQQPFQQTQSVFQQQSPFQQQTQSIFQQHPQQTQSIFQVQPQQPFQQIANQLPITQQPSPFQQQKQQDSNNENSIYYSTIEQLTPEEITAYDDQQFVFGCIPEKPPTLAHVKN